MEPKEVSQLKYRWQRNNRSCRKFFAGYKHVCQRNKSGNSESNIMRDAHAIYMQDKKTSFKLEYVWYVMRKQPKWLVQFEESSKRKKDFCS